MRYFEDLDLGEAVIIGSHALTADDIINFATEWDPQPFHIDPEFAAKSPMQGLFASSAHTYAIAAKLLNQVDPPIAGIASIKHEMELPVPARPGDILSLKIRYVDKRLSTSKPDRGLVTMESELFTQTGTVVLRLRSLLMVKRRPT